MKNATEHKVSNFWTGFAFGISATLLASYLLATKKGREVMKKILDVTEDLDKHLEELVKDREGLTDEEKPVEEKSPINQVQSGLHTVIDKIKSFTEKREEAKKFFVKE